MSKLPQNNFSKLEELMDEDDEWTVETFRKRLKRYITAQEPGDQQFYICTIREMKTYLGRILIALVCRIRL